jgi:gliding motility-associated-like protein
MKFFSFFVCLLAAVLLSGQTCESTGKVVIFSNYDGGYLNININQNIPDLKIGIASYEPTEVNIYGDFASNVSEVHYVGYFPLQGTGNFHCDAALATGSINAPAGANTSIVSLPPPTLLTALDPELGAFGITIGDNTSITSCSSCNNDTYQGGSNTAEQIGDYFVNYFGGELLFLKTQYPCWCGEYNLDLPPSCCFEVATGGSETTIVITGPSSICPGETAILTASGGYDSYLWSNGATSSNITITTPGIYTVIGTNECGQGSGVLEVEDCVPVPEDCTNGIDDDGDGDTDLFDDDCPCELWSDLNVTLNNTLLLCYDDSNATITALPENGLAPYTYNWTDENATSIGNAMTIDNLRAGAYALQLTDGYGCSVDAQLTIDQPEALTLSANISPIACEGEPLGIIEATASGGTPPYLFALDSAPFAMQNSFAGLSAGFYNLLVEDANGCQQLTADLEIAETPSIDLSLGQEQTVCLGEFITLKPEVFPSTADLNFFWSSSTTIPCDSCQQLYFQPTETANYQLTVSKANGCSASASLVVNVTADRSLYIPNVFSPNDDGLNDFFQIFPGKSVAALSLLQIYDRWGGLVFEGDPQQGWNGKMGQQSAANGVYLYVLQLNYLDGVEEVISGDVILIR